MSSSIVSISALRAMKAARALVLSVWRGMHYLLAGDAIHALYTDVINRNADHLIAF